MKYKNYYCNPKYSEGEKSYYGSIYGLPEASPIEAKNLEDFELVFHQAVDDYLAKEEEAKKESKRKWVIACICIVILFGVAIISCPDKQAHKEAITEMVNEVIAENSRLDEEEASLALLGRSLVQSASDWVLEGGLIVKNHFVCSVGKFNNGSEEKMVSIGVFGHVFTFGRQALSEKLEEWL